MAPEGPAARRKRARRIVTRLAEAYPDAVTTALRYGNAFELLVATILSAQCTDKKVNEVTPALFKRFPTPGALAAAPPGVVEALIRPTGFFRQKTRSIQAVALDLHERFGGEVPPRLEELVKLRGVGRKTANLVLGSVHGTPGLVVDTHMKRVNQRLELTEQDDPDAIERDLMEEIPEAEWTPYSHRVIHHGRVCCTARRPRCESCPLAPDCPWPRRHGVLEAAGARSAARAPAARRTGSAARAEEARGKKGAAGKAAARGAGGARKKGARRRKASRRTRR